MNFRGILCASIFTAAGLASAQNAWQYLATESEFTAVTGNTQATFASLAVHSSGDLAVYDDTPPSGGNVQANIMLVRPNQSPKITRIATRAQLLTALDGANGTTPLPAEIYPIGLDFNNNGQVIVFCLDSDVRGALFAINTTAPYAINVLSCSVNSGTSPVKGGSGFFCRGNKAYLLFDRDEGAPTDRLSVVDTSTLVNNGSRVPTLVIDEGALAAASGGTTGLGGTMFLNDGEAIDDNNLVLLNGNYFGTNSNMVKVTLTPAAAASASRYVNASDTQTDLGATSIGYSAMTLNGANPILSNRNGSGTGARGIVFLSNIASPNADASLDSEAKIKTDLGISSNINIEERCLVFDPLRQRATAAHWSFPTSGIIARGLAANVDDWQMY